MMKPVKLMLAIGILAATFTSCDEDMSSGIISAKELPTPALTFIETHFPSEQIVLAKVDKELIETTYEVVLTNHTEIDFTKAGEWHEVDCKTLEVPSAIIPTQISAKVHELYPDFYIVTIDKDTRDYEVKLNNGIELKFDLNFNVVDFDY